MPHVDDQDDPVLLGAIPGLVLEEVVEHEALPFFPFPALLADANSAVAARNLNTEMAAQPHIRRPPMRGDLGARAQSGEVDEAGGGAHRRVPLDDPGQGGTGIAVLVPPPPAFVEEDDVPVARSPDALALAMESPGFQGHDLVADRGVLLLQIDGQREVLGVVPRCAPQVRVPSAHRILAGGGKGIDVPVKAFQPWRRGRVR